MWQKRRGQQETNRHLQKMTLKSTVGESIPPPPPCAGRTQGQLRACTHSQPFCLRLGAEERGGKVLR